MSVIIVGDVMNFIITKIISVKTPAINDQALGNIAMKMPSGAGD